MKVLFIVFVLIFSINSYAQQREVMNHFPLPGEIIGTNQKQNQFLEKSFHYSNFKSSKNNDSYIDTLCKVRFHTNFYDVINSDSFYYISGYTQNSSLLWLDTINFTLLTRLKVSKSGQIIWCKIDSLMRGYHFTQTNSSIIKTTDGNLIQSGVIYNDLNRKNNYLFKLPTFTKFNQNGDTLWQKLYADTVGRKGGDWPMDIIAEKDGGFTVAALTPSITKSVYDSVSDWWYNDTTYVSLIRYDSLGNEVRRKSHFVGGEKVPIQIGLVLKLNDGGYIVGGTNQFYGPTPTKSFYIFKTDSQFNWQWKKVFSRTELDRTFMQIKPLSDSTYVFAVLRADTPTYISGGQLNYEYYHQIGIMDKDFNIIKDTLFIMVMDKFSWGYTGSTGLEVGLEVINDSLFVVCADNSSGCNLFKMNTNFNVVWSRLISHYPDFKEETKKMRLAEDGGFLIVGKSYKDVDTKGWFVKTDSLGFALPNKADTLYHLGLQEMKQNKTDLLVYPNPTTNAFYISCNKSGEVLEIYDILGRIEQKIFLNDGENKVETSYLVKGIYFIKIIEENKSFRTVKLIVN